MTIYAQDRAPVPAPGRVGFLVATGYTPQAGIRPRHALIVTHGASPGFYFFEPGVIRTSYPWHPTSIPLGLALPPDTVLGLDNYDDITSFRFYGGDQWTILYAR